MPGFFYIRVLVCFGVASALMAALLSLGGQLAKGGTSAPALALLDCARAVETARCGEDCASLPGLSVRKAADASHAEITAACGGTVLTTAYLPSHEDEAQDARQAGQP